MRKFFSIKGGIGYRVQVLVVFTLGVLIGHLIQVVAVQTAPPEGKGGGSGGNKSPAQVLTLWDTANQFSVAGYGKQVRLFEFNGQTYIQSWQSKAVWQHKASWIGDSDNDGSDELVSLGLTRNKGLELYVFESGSTGEPSWRGGSFGGNKYVTIMIADADNDGKNDIVMTLRDRVEVWKYDPATAGYTQFWQGPIEDPRLMAVDVGDANNDGLRDIVAGTSYPANGYFVVYPFNPETGRWDRVVSASFGPASTLEEVRVRDVDGDLKNEVIGGTDSRLVIWEQVGNAYNVSFSSNQIGFTPGVDAADFNGNGLPEIVVVASKGVDSGVYIFEYDGTTTYVPVWSGLTGIAIDTVRDGDSDNDGQQEFILGTIRGISVYEYNAGTQGYEAIYTNEWGDEIEWISIQ